MINFQFNSLLGKIRNKEHNILEYFIYAVIIISSVLIGVETDNDISRTHHHTFRLLDIIILGIFIAEIIIKLIAEGKKPWRYFLDPWNLFDFIIVLLSFLPYIISHGSGDSHAILAFRLVRILRAFRVFRTARLITHVRPLQVLIETLIKTLPSMIYVVILLSIIFYIYAVIGFYLFERFDPLHFGTLGSSFNSLFESISGNWPGIMEGLVNSTEKIIINGKEIIKPFEYPWLVPVYFISFYFVGGLIVLNLFIGVIVAELSAIRAHKEREEIRESFIDDLNIEQYDLMLKLENQIQEINHTFKQLQIAMDKNKSGTNQN